ncbi:MAG: outer membrane lipoprotein-sorting protein [Nitrospirota bacterium]
MRPQNRLLSVWALSLTLNGLLAFCLAGGSAWAQDPTGLDIMKKQRELQRAKDEEETQRMTLVNKNGESKERKVVRLTVTSREDLSKILIRFLAPRDVENSGLLTWEAKDGNDDQWLYLPAAKKTKRIASSGKKNRFMGTDFAFEDLRPENLAVHTYNLVGSEIVDGQDCFVIEAIPANEKQAEESGYSKRKLWIRKDIYYTVKRDYYDKKGQLEKVQTDRNLINVKGSIWRVNEIEMRDVQAGTKTVVVIEARAQEKGLKDSLFTEAGLEKGGQ